MKIDDILEKGNESLIEDPIIAQSELFQAVLEATKRQIEKCGLYRQLCKQKNFDPRRDLKSFDDFKNIPFLTTANFKGKTGRPEEFLTVPREEIRCFGTSSGTSGDPSLIGRDVLNLQRIKKQFEIYCEGTYNLPKYYWNMMFMPPFPHHSIEEEGDAPTMPWMPLAIDMCNDIPFEERCYALRLVDPDAAPSQRFAPDPEGVMQFLESNPASKGPGWITGSVPLLYRMAMDIYEQTGQSFALGEDSLVAFGGGWKTYSGEAVPKEQFRDDLYKVLGIPPSRIRDIYTFTEIDILFTECEHHNIHVPPWTSIIVRDFETLEPVEFGEKGLINVINPLAHGFAGVSVLQDDVVRIVQDDGCPCGIRGNTFEVIGRAEGSEAKGCGAQVAEMARME